MRSELREDPRGKPRDLHPKLRCQIPITRMPFAEFDGTARAEVQTVEIHRADALPPAVLRSRPDFPSPADQREKLYSYIIAPGG